MRASPLSEDRKMRALANERAVELLRMSFTAPEERRATERLAWHEERRKRIRRRGVSATLVWKDLTAD
jgi:hypothetical protein